MGSKTLKDYGLEYIDEMANDRIIAQQEAEVVISGAKRTHLNPSGHYTLKEVEKYTKFVQEQVAHILDAELNRITIKSLGRLRRIITQEDKFNKPEEDSEKFSEVNKRLQDEITKLREGKSKMFEEKNKEIRELQAEVENIRSKEKKSSNIIIEKDEEIKKLQANNLSLKEENGLYKRLYDQSSSQLANYENLLNKIKEEIKSKDEDFIVALEEMYESSGSAQQQLIDEAISQATEALRRDHKLEIDSLNTKINIEQERIIEVKTKYENELKLLKEELQQTKEEAKTVSKAREIYGVEAPSTTALILNYTQRLLSTHPLYAAMLILINLGGSMPMPSLAKSVGANPMKLREFLSELQTKGLVTLSDDNPPIVEIVNL